MAKKYRCPECGEEYDEPGMCIDCADPMNVYEDYHGGHGRFGPDLVEVDDDEDDETLDNEVYDEDRKLRIEVEYQKSLEQMKNMPAPIGYYIGCFVVFFIMAYVFWVIFF